jgi:hypothetical protein
MTRRTFLKLIPMAMLGGLVSKSKPSSAQISTACAAATRQYQGTNLSSWTVALGDALYACPGESPVSLADIGTENFDYSELRANIQPRHIMAHNITYLKITDSEALNFIHTCTFNFRLPFIPTPDVNASLNAQTLEGGIFVWDGDRTRLDYGMAFQWVLNPWVTPNGILNTWTGSAWASVGQIVPDTNWHTVTMIIDFFNRTASLTIDTTSYPTQFTETQKPGFGTGTDARFQAEIVSVDPRLGCQVQAMHKAQLKDWTWTWERCNVLMPFVAK